MAPIVDQIRTRPASIKAAWALRNLDITLSPQPHSWRTFHLAPTLRRSPTTDGWPHPPTDGSLRQHLRAPHLPQFARRLRARHPAVRRKSRTVTTRRNPSRMSSNVIATCLTTSAGTYFVVARSSSLKVPLVTSRNKKDYKWIPYDPESYTPPPPPKRDLDNYFHVKVQYQVPASKPALVISDWSDKLLHFMR